MKRVKSEASVLVEAPNGNGHRTGEKSADPQKKKKTKEVVISAPNFQTVEFLVRGKAPYVQNAFSKKATEQIREIQEEGSTAKGKKVRLPKDFEGLFLQAQHIAVTDDVKWNGIPSSGIRASLISACRTVNGMPMTKAKLAATEILADGYDINDGQALTRITKGEPRHVEHMVKLPSGVPDIRVRAWWDPGWEAVVRIEFDADMLKLSDVGNLLMRAGRQVGWGEGRPDSKNSAGMGWGTFSVVS